MPEPLSKIAAMVTELRPAFGPASGGTCCGTGRRRVDGSHRGLLKSATQGRIAHDGMKPASSVRQGVSLLALLLFSSLTFSCATIMNGSKQDVGFASDPAGAKVTVDGVSLGITPLTVSLTRRQPHTVSIEGDGYPLFETQILRKISAWAFNPWYLFLPVDYLSGGLFKLTPARLQVSLADGRIVEKFDKTMWNIPPLNMGRIAGEILGGAFGGAVVAYGLLNREGTKEDALGAASAIIMGSTIGSVLGVYLVGNLGNETGSLGKTVQGSILGLLGSMGLLILIPISDNDRFLAIANPLFLVMSQSIAATVGFNTGRRYKTPSAAVETGLINLNDGQMSLASPLIYMRPNPFITGNWVPTVDLVRVTF